MKKDYNIGAKYIYDFTKEIIDECGPRLPGSAEESKAADMIADIFTNTTGVKAKKEKFLLSPKASIGAIPILGGVGLLGLIVFYFSAIASLVLTAGALILAIFQIFTYSGVFDILFKRAISTNVYSVIEPKEKVDYTLVYSGHIDSSWCWKHSAVNPATGILKTVYGVIGIIVVLVLSILSISKGWTVGFDGATQTIITILPALFIPGMIWIMNFLSWDKKLAAPGAMDNLSGIGLAMYQVEQFAKNPELQPKNCRVILLGLGSEEAGLKGAMDFAKRHAKDGLLVNPYIVNLDSFRDYDHFNAVKGDLWLFSHFDKEMIDMAMDTFDEIGVNKKIISNPVGGCDSTPFCRKGFKTVTLNAQNPTMTNYYHTFRDSYDDLDMNTLAKSCEMIEVMTRKIIEKESKN